jgi:pyridoxine 4-dehydrogenase
MAGGIATWASPTLVGLLRLHAARPRPHVLLSRVGLTLTHTQLRHGTELAELLSVPTDGRWGMSPFAGAADHPVWTSTDLAAFFVPPHAVAGVPAAFRLAYDLPPVARIAVGTSCARHLEELVGATRLAVDDDAVARYRSLLARGA